MDSNAVDIHDDSGRYLQEYAQSLENLPSEIQYHWAEIKNRYEQAQAPEMRVEKGQKDLSKLHNKWFSQDTSKRDKIARQEPHIIKQMESDYNTLEELASERISLAEDALKLVDRHLIRLQNDLDKHDQDHPELAPILPMRSYTIPHGTKGSDEEDLDEDEEELEDEEEIEEEIQKQEAVKVKLEADYQAMMANRNQKKKRKEARDADQDEPLYCFCQQVSYGEMVACDGENCPYEWFHMDCLGLDEPPKGAWYCDDCATELHKRKHSSVSNQQLHKKMKRKKD